MRHILLYTFNNPRQISYKLVIRLQAIVDTYFIGSLNGLNKKVIEKNYDTILGIGDFRTGVKKMRIERICRNRYGRQKIIMQENEMYGCSLDLPESSYVYWSDKATNGPCNRSAYLVADTVNKNKLQTKVGFLHVPRDYSFNRALEYIQESVIFLSR